MQPEDLTDLSIVAHRGRDGTRGTRQTKAEVEEGFPALFWLHARQISG